MKFTKDEKMLMMLYNPGSRTGLIKELSRIRGMLTREDKDLKKMMNGLLPKLNQISDKDYDQILDSCL
ncbi:transposon-transfer assisting family protein [Galactobacillus timonensis]|uniref:transposon-transfer assisting family protein n=1 Tax=Galactobacillus timonensis TaxID=2041840 RepID=UPI000C81C2D0|nr:transposon-transfer assisting family protein [Galactobacillus timonensis]